MSHQQPSLARILLLVIGSTLAGALVSSWLARGVQDKPMLTPAQSLVGKGDGENVSRR